MQVTFRGKHLFRLVMSVSGMAIKFECCISVCWKLQKNNVVVGSSRLFPFDQKKGAIFYLLWVMNPSFLQSNVVRTPDVRSRCTNVVFYWEFSVTVTKTSGRAALDYLGRGR